MCLPIVSSTGFSHEFCEICKNTFFIGGLFDTHFLHSGFLTCRKFFPFCYISFPGQTFLRQEDNVYVSFFFKPIFDQCSTYGKTRYLVFTRKMFEKHLWKSDILSKVIDLHLYLKCHPSTGVFQIFCK